MRPFQIVLLGLVVLAIAAWFVVDALKPEPSLFRLLEYRRARRAPAAPPASGGVTLMPGESARLPLPPELDAQLAGLAQEGHKITTKNGELRRGPGGRYTQSVEVLVDGEPYARFEIGFTQ